MARTRSSGCLEMVTVPFDSRHAGSGSIMATSLRAASADTARAQPSSVSAVPVSLSASRSSILPPSSPPAAMASAS